MDSSRTAIAAMAMECKRLILAQEGSHPELPLELQSAHLVSMCDQVARHASKGVATRLHRWIGFIQCAMLAQGMLDLNGLKAMFDDIKGARLDADADLEDLLDHLDPESSFEFELGGES